MRRAVLLAVVPAFGFTTGASLHAQDTVATGATDVFLDCQARGCDSQHFRNEIRFVNWVRDRTVADVHLLITSQDAAGGGEVYELSFIGLRDASADSTTVSVTVGQNDTESERRDALTNRIAQGLLPYVQATAVANGIRIEFDPDEGGAAPVTATDDPWNFWVFSTQLDAEMEGESREQSREFSASADASRTTADWKLELDLRASYEEDEFELSDRTARRVRKDYEVETLVAKALAPLWSAGVSAEAGRSTFENQDLYTRTAALVEYSLYPYEQFSRRRITLQYSAGVRHMVYEDTTIYDQVRETRADQRLELSMDFQQPWGSARTSLSGSHYFHDTSRYQLSANGGIDVRLFRGFSLDLSGSYSRVHDQLYIPKGDADDEEVLLQRRELETNYRYDMRVGLRYTFGSVYNNIVNRRLNRGGGGDWN
ncbi:MAG: hypothetical protein WEF86_02550 [Gemmatimonadota bacterium]